MIAAAAVGGRLIPKAKSISKSPLDRALAIRLQVYRRIFGTTDLYRYALGPNPSIHIIVNGVFSVANKLEIQK